MMSSETEEYPSGEVFTGCVRGIQSPAPDEVLNFS